MNKTNWALKLTPLIEKYKDKAHPLAYKNLYQLVVMVILSAQDSDKHINEIAPTFFKAYPNMPALSKASTDALYAIISGVRNFANKTKWLLELAQLVKKDDNIPLTMEALIQLPGIGRKSANVIMRGANVKAQGVIVDLHVIRVAPRIGIASGTDPKKIEKQIMDVIPEKDWGEVGMAISFLGRETCRPSNPKCYDCIINACCSYFNAPNHKQ